jgi:hypothetical protein
VATDRTHSELGRYLAEQLYFLDRSCAEFDRGADIEFRRLAHSLRILIHETGVSHALLSQMGIRNQVQMYESTTGIPVEGNENGTWSLAVITGGRYLPKLDDSLVCDFGGVRSLVPFEDWWTRPVLQSKDGHTFTRESLVLVVANQDGGSHVDVRLNDGYLLLTSGQGFGFSFVSTDQARPQPSPSPASVRQIAHEVLVSLALAMPQAFPSEVNTARYVRNWPSPSWVYGVDGMVTSMIHSCEIDDDGNPVPHPATAGWSDPISRQSPCRCGSGEKYKDCHGF